MKNSRPVIEIEKTQTDRWIEAITILFLLVHIIVVGYYYSVLPEIIPSHFNSKGEVDGYGPKVYLFILPVMGIGVYLLIKFFVGILHRCNHLGMIKDEIARSKYLFGVKILRMMSLLIQCVLFYIAYRTSEAANGGEIGIGGEFIFVINILLIAPILYYSFIKK